MKKEELKEELKSIQFKLSDLRSLDGVFVDSALYAYLRAAEYAVDMSLSSCYTYAEDYD